MNHHGLSRHPVSVARRVLRRRVSVTTQAGHDEAGFTLIELIVVVAIMPIIVGAIATALVSVLSLQGSVGSRLSDSNDALVSSVNFNRDVQSAQQMTAQSTPGCGATTQNQLLGLEWGTNSAAPGGYDTVVSYISAPISPATVPATYIMTRQVCTFGTSTTPSSTTMVAHDIDAPTLTILGAKNAQGVFATITPNFLVSMTNPTGWLTTRGVTQVSLAVQAPASGFNYTLVGLPGQSKSQSSASSLAPLSATGCGFATPGTGTYATQLCFADFTGYSWSAESGGHCQTMQRPIANTPYTLSFCLLVNANVVAPSVIPTYYNPSGDDSEAFLGNNGFYIGIPGEPALYTNVNGAYATMTFTNIQVLDAAGDPATGWTLVTGDAESTDSGEWIAFSNTTGGGLNWSILPNNGSSDLWGNACYDDNDANNSGALAWTGPVPATAAAVGNPKSGPPSSANATALSVNPTTYATGVPSVLCESDQQLNKTGTLMLASQEPTGSSSPQSLVISTLGAGYQAIFLGVRL